MSKATKRKAGKVEFGRYIVADPAICHGKLTFKGTRVFVADVLADVERGLSWDFLIYRWGGGKISKAAITEAVQLARNAFLDDEGGQFISPAPREPAGRKRPARSTRFAPWVGHSLLHDRAGSRAAEYHG